MFQASQQSPAPARPSFRVSVNLIEVDVISTDAIGTRVPDLRANDVEVTEDGKPQQIVNFEWVDLKPADPPSVGTRLALGPQREEIRRSIAMIDDSGPRAEQDVLPVITAARNFVWPELLFTSNARYLDSA